MLSQFCWSDRNLKKGIELRIREIDWRTQSYSLIQMLLNIVSLSVIDPNDMTPREHCNVSLNSINQLTLIESSFVLVILPDIPEMLLSIKL